jgi:arabinose-5-phosphate isomerase
MSIKEFADKQLKTVARCFDSLDQIEAERFVSSLTTSKNCIFFTGVGKNGHVASKAASTFNSTGMKVTYIDPVDAVHGDLGMVSKDDMIVAISKSGNTEELVVFLSHCAKRTANIWIIHSRMGNESMNYAKNQIYLDIDSEADHMNVIPTSSVAAYCIFMQSVACEIARRRNVDLDGFVINHPGGSIGKLTT